ncbi:conserved hypothetical protein [Ricinus communis]|uniref:Uncharacterized protein n=1 Tax=Ricinus communis TaxID=3988 RepID=B9RQ68_RICCO|nr:conserved hypothetical protein [Ricinus communis]
MSVKKTLSLNNSKSTKPNHHFHAKRRPFARCFSSVEIYVEPGTKSLKNLDSNKFKEEIKRWAKAVVAYARQVSDRFGSSRRSDRTGSSREVDEQ